MRVKPKRWSAFRSAFTYSANMDLVGITGDFTGGFVQVNAVAQEVNPTAGNWAALQILVDGVLQGALRIIWQATGQSNVQVSLSHTVLVPQGRHRVSVQLSSSNGAAWLANGAYLDVTES